MKSCKKNSYYTSLMIINEITSFQFSNIIDFQIIVTFKSNNILLFTNIFFSVNFYNRHINLILKLS